jgi:hypothetical protein
MTFVRQAASLAIALVCSLLAGCGSDSSLTLWLDAGADAATGQLSVVVDLPAGVVINVVDYVVAGPTPMQGSVPAGAIPTIDFVVGGLPAGTGYSIQLSASDSAGDTCTGGASFDIAAGTLTGITVQLQCGNAQDAATPGDDSSPPADADAGADTDATDETASSPPDAATGSVAIDASVTVVPPPPPPACPGIDAFSVIPAALTVGTTSSVHVSTIPGDVTPTIAWTATDVAGQTGAGTFADPTAASTTFQCTQTGQVTVAVSVATGPCVGAPFTTMSVVVTCDPSKSKARRNLAIFTGGIR